MGNSRLALVRARAKKHREHAEVWRRGLRTRGIVLAALGVGVATAACTVLGCTSLLGDFSVGSGDASANASGDASAIESGDGASDGTIVIYNDADPDAPVDSCVSDPRCAASGSSCLDMNTVLTCDAIGPGCFSAITMPCGATAVCANGMCSACDPVSNGQFFVDTVGGDDSTATGSGTFRGVPKASCAFGTIPGALASAVGGSTVIVKGPATVPGAFTVPATVTLSSTGGAVTLQPGGKSIFLDSGAQIIGGTGAQLTIDQQNATNSIGVWVQSVTATHIEAVTIQNANTGVYVTMKGVLSVGPGVSVSGCNAGIGVDTGGSVAISVPAGAAPAIFAGNVTGLAINWGTLTLNGVRTSDSAGSIETNANTYAGLYVGGNSTATITGLVSYGNRTFGMWVVGGAHAKVRKSTFLNTDIGAGVYPDSTNNNSADMSGIDFGTPSDPGYNTLQHSAAQGDVNSGAGLCLAVPASSGTLNAAGNSFSGIDCAGGGGNLTTGACNSATDVGFFNATGNSINVAECTYP